MYEVTEEIELFKTEYILDKYAPEDVLVFDIETTGFSPASTMLYMIGCAYIRDGKAYLKQWFVDEAADEKLTIIKFLSFMKEFKAIVHYNGNGFDIPYIIKRSAILGISCDLSTAASIDIYKYLSPLKKLFKTVNMKQKSIEAFMGIGRDDEMDGGKLIKVYENFLKNPDAEGKRLLLLHNHDDVIGLSRLLPVLNYCQITDRNYIYKSAEVIDNDYVITYDLEYPIPVKASLGDERFYYTVYNKTLKTSSKMFTGELRFFFNDHKNYYYLPAEDRAVHKSVASFVDKGHRFRAKPSNCYMRKEGTYIPQYDKLCAPFFSFNYNDPVTYFEISDAFTGNTDLITKYAENIIRHQNA